MKHKISRKCSICEKLVFFTGEEDKKVLNKSVETFDKSPRALTEYVCEQCSPAFIAWWKSENE